MGALTTKPWGGSLSLSFGFKHRLLGLIVLGIHGCTEEHQSAGGDYQTEGHHALNDFFNQPSCPAGLISLGVHRHSLIRHRPYSRNNGDRCEWNRHLGQPHHQEGHANDGSRLGVAMTAAG